MYEERLAEYVRAIRATSSVFSVSNHKSETFAQNQGNNCSPVVLNPGVACNCLSCVLSRPCRAVEFSAYLSAAMGASSSSLSQTEWTPGTIAEATNAHDTVATAQMLAFAMARHERLGALSPAAALDTDSLRCIGGFVHASRLEAQREDYKLAARLSALQAFGVTEQDVQKLREAAVPEVYELRLVNAGQGPPVRGFI